MIECVISLFFLQVGSRGWGFDQLSPIFLRKGLVGFDHVRPRFGDFCTIRGRQGKSCLSPNLCCLVLAQVELKLDVTGCRFGHAWARSAAQFFSTALCLAILVLISLEPTEV